MNETTDPQHPKHELEEALKNGSGPAVVRLMLSVLTGATSTTGKAVGLQAGGPAGAELGELVGSAAGGAIGGVVAEFTGKKQERIDHLLYTWLQMQQDEIKEIGLTLFEVMARLDLEDAKVNARLESPEYLRLLKKCFRDWSAAESEEKRVLIRNLLINAAGAHIVSDGIVNLFVRWIDIYSEEHFRVISAVYNNQEGITRGDIWQKMYPSDAIPRENSSEADLFKLLILDLSTGHIIRQHRPVDANGRFMPQPKKQRRSGRSYTSAFDSEDRYILTELGQKFVHYTMEDRVQKIAAASSTEGRN